MQPVVSIILPVRNEGEFIVNCLRSISAQSYPKEHIEILVVDGMSEDGTLGKIYEFKTKHQTLKVKVFDNPKKTVSSSRNIAIKYATGDVILCMDAHAVYSPNYIRSCVEIMETTSAANVGGHMRALPADNTALAYASVLANDSPFGLGGGKFHDPNYEGFVETVWMGCYKKSVLDKVGLYDERRTRTEDIDLNRRLINAGYKIYLSPKIKAWYYPRANLKELWRQRWADGYEITHFLPDNPKAPRLRHFIPLAFVSTILLLTLACLISLKSLTGSTGLNILNRSNVLNNIGHIALLLLVIVLGAYLSAMLFFIGQAGRSVQRTGDSGQGALSEKRKAESGQSDQFKAESLKFKEDTRRQETGDRRGPIVTQSGDAGFNTKYRIPNTGYGLHPLLLLPLVFLTLHFSYGLGSIWGLVTLAGWAKKRNNV